MSHEIFFKISDGLTNLTLVFSNFIKWVYPQNAQTGCQVSMRLKRKHILTKSNPLSYTMTNSNKNQQKRCILTLSLGSMNLVITCLNVMIHKIHLCDNVSWENFKQHFCNISRGEATKNKVMFRMQTDNHNFRKNVATDKK